MRFHSSLSDSESSTDAVEQIVADALGQQGDKIDIAFFFFTGHHAADAAEIAERLWLELDPQCLIGCSAEGVIGIDREIERAPGMALLVGHIPGVRVHPFHIRKEQWRELLNEPESLAELVGYGPQTRAMIGLGDPFTTPLNQWLAKLDEVCPGVPLIGGMASSAQGPQENVLLRNDTIFDEGFVGVSLSDDIQVQAVVSQGCRPIGRTVVITKAHDNVIEQLGGRPAMQVLQGIVNEMPESEQQLLQNGLLIGRAISEYRESFGRGDFLVRTIIGVEESTGGIGVGDHVRVGQTVQFHVRDAATADEDLSSLLTAQSNLPPAAGGLLFSCNGRGTRLFDKPCHDIGIARQQMPQTPMAGFFAAGEFGPVGNRNFVHGHTASFALFRQRNEK